MKKDVELMSDLSNIIEYTKIIWNLAIEEAIKLAETSKGYPIEVSEEIRKLKK